MTGSGCRPLARVAAETAMGFAAKAAVKKPALGGAGQESYCGVAPGRAKPPSASSLGGAR
jgi:hypothetical protein